MENGPGIDAVLMPVFQPEERASVVGSAVIFEVLVPILSVINERWLTAVRFRRAVNATEDGYQDKGRC